MPRNAENAYSGDYQQTADSKDSLEYLFPTIEYQFSQLLPVIQLDRLSNLFSSYAARELKLSVPDDFVILAARTMMQLKDNHCSNVLYNMAKAIGTIREDGSDSRLPIKRMPMGLIKYIASFLLWTTYN